MELTIRIKTVVDSVRTSFDKLQVSMNGVAQKSKTVANAFNGIKKHDRLFNNMTKDANRASKEIGQVGKAMSGLNMLLGAGMGYAFGSALQEAVNSAISMVETVNMFSVATGEAVYEAEAFAESVSAATGFDLTNIQNAVGTFASLARSMGLTNEQALTLSTNSYKLAVDLASLYNVSITQALGDLRSGLVGQSETMYKYGVDVTEAALKQEALNQGISKSVRNMSQGEKMALRYAVMIRQTTLAQTDLANTINSPANQLKILGERFVTLSRSIGSVFMPVLGAILPYLNAIVKVLIDMFNAIAKFFGYTPPKAKEISRGFSGIADDATDSADGVDKLNKSLKDLNKYTMGFDELNIIDTSQAETGAGAGAGEGVSVGAVDWELPSYDAMFESIHQKSQDIYADINQIVEKFKELSMPLVLANWDNLKTKAGELWQAVSKFGGTIGAGLALFYEKVLVPIGVWLIEKGVPAVFDVFAGVFNVLSEAINALLPGAGEFIDNFLAPIANFAGDLFVTIMTDIADALDRMALWIKDNPEKFRAATELIGGFFLAWKTVEVMAFVQQSGGVIAALKSITDAIKAGTLAKIADKVETIALTLMYAKDFVVGLIASTIEIGKNTLAWIANKVAVIAGYIALGIWNTICAVATTVTELFSLAMGALTLPVLLVIAAIAALVAIVILLYKNWDKVKEVSAQVWANIKEVWSDVGQWFMDNVVTPITNAFSTVYTAISGAFTSAKIWLSKNIPALVKSVIGWFTELPDSLYKIGVNMIKGLWNGILSVGKWLYNKIASYFGVMWDIAKERFQGLGNGQQASYEGISHFATGGFPTSGQMFIANEAGAELVGSIGGKTAVVNNDQIVEAVSNGVANAVASVIGSQSQQPIIVELDGEVIYKNQQKISRNKGYDFGMGAFAR